MPKRKSDENEPLPEVDPSLLTPEQLEEYQSKPSHKGFWLFCLVMAILIAVCFIVIFSLGGPTE